MRERTLLVLILAGLVGIYIAAWLAYQKWQTYQKTFTSNGGGLAGLLALAK